MRILFKSRRRIRFTQITIHNTLNTGSKDSHDSMDKCRINGRDIPRAAGYLYSLVGYLIGIMASAFFIRAIKGGVFVNNILLGISAAWFELGLSWISHLSVDSIREGPNFEKQILLRDLSFRKHCLNAIAFFFESIENTLPCVIVALAETWLLRYSQYIPKVLRINEIMLALHMLPLRSYYVIVLAMSIINNVTYCSAIFYTSKSSYALHSAFLGAWKITMNCIFGTPFGLLYHIAVMLCESIFPHLSQDDLKISIWKYRGKNDMDKPQPKIINKLHNPRNVALLSMCMGLISGTGIGLAATFKSFFGLGVYLYLFGEFHILEYVCLSINDVSANMSDFILNNGCDYYLALFSSILEYFINYRYLSMYGRVSMLQVASLLFAIIFQIIRSLAIIEAGVNFSHELGRPKLAHKSLVKTGLYSICRHPSYVAFYGLTITMQIAMLARLNILIDSVVLFRFFRSRIIQEEKILVEIFGKEYEKYSEDVGPFFPKNLNVLFRRSKSA